MISWAQAMVQWVKTLVEMEEPEFKSSVRTEVEDR